MWPSRYVIHPRCLALCRPVCPFRGRGGVGGNVSEEARPAGALWAAVPHRASRAYMVPRRSILVRDKAVTSPRFTPSRNAVRKREVSSVLLIIEANNRGWG